MSIKRNTNYELLRIISMFMIVTIHANMYLSMFASGELFTVVNGIINGICNIGVTCFVLISGYYGIKYKLSKLINMELMMIVFSILETIFLWLLMPENMNGNALIEQVIKSFFPVVSRKYWFYSCYIVLFLLSSYIEKFIDILSQKEFSYLLGLLLLLFSVFPTFFYFEIVPDNGKGLVQMIFVYMGGVYIRKYRNGKYLNWLSSYRGLILFAILWIVNAISHEYPLQIGGIYHHLCKDNSITNIVMAVILFLQFGKLQIQSKIINSIASQVFAVFALNNSIVLIVYHYMRNFNILVNYHQMGFVLMLGIDCAIMLGCFLVGYIVNGLLKTSYKLINV